MPFIKVYCVSNGCTAIYYMCRCQVMTKSGVIEIAHTFSFILNIKKVRLTLLIHRADRMVFPRNKFKRSSIATVFKKEVKVD